ncbi:hypothetical protein Smic_10510 [Streptomyces microflavus]|uniref:Uncharacterized protein n=1 Tax=Streptomyces microflavus TaxID=1919 RepID=A0A7J0CL54_STRMI|nr:hypothetical protein Smic_10510 [Streptomyces microflavus]
MTSPTSRRTVLTAAVAAAAGAGAAASAGPAAAAPGSTPSVRPSAPRAAAPLVDNRFWHTYTDWRWGSGDGTRVLAGVRPGLQIATPAGRTDYTDPHTGKTAAWEYATWTSPVHRSAVPATELITSWNARTPAGTWIAVELGATYADSTATPWFVMGRWASGDGDIRRTSVDDQGDPHSSVWTDTLSVDDAASGVRFAAFRIRLTLYRTPAVASPPPSGASARWPPTSPTASRSRRAPRPTPANCGSRATPRTSTSASTPSTTTAARRGAAPPPRR